MADITIASGGTYDLVTPLTGGTNIEFANSPTIGGTLSIEPTGFVITPVPPGLGIGGTVGGYIPGDTVIINDIEALYTELNGGNPDVNFNSFIELEAHYGGDIIIPPEGSGDITGSFAISLFVPPPITYSATLSTELSSFIYAVEEEIFGPSAANDTLTIHLVPESGTMTEGVVTATNSDPCFAAGTSIATARGEVLVEDLRVGDLAMLAEGGTAPVIWIGHRDLDLNRHPAPQNVRPVRIAPGALGHGIPAGELVVSPDHALFLDGALVQARDLIDGVLIKQDNAIASVRYYHVELPEHGVLLANGAPAESYLDTGHRGVFANAGAPVILHPDLMQLRREAESAAPLVLGGPELAAIRARLHAHRLMLGYIIADVPVVMLKAGSQLLVPVSIEGGRFTFHLPGNVTEAVLATPVFVPAEIDPASNDRRVLGVALSDIWVDGRPVALETVFAETDLHKRSAGDPNIWTRGAARMKLPPGTATITLGIAGAPRQWRACAA